MDNNEDTLFESKFYVPIVEFPVIGSSPVILDSVKFAIIIPYFDNADSLNLYYKDRPLVRTSLSVLSGLSGGEDFGSGEGGSGDGSRDFSCIGSVCLNQKWKYPLVGIVTLALVVIVFIFVRARKK